MALREIVQHGDDILRKKCKDVPEITDKIITLLDDMVETMRFEGRGIGLAAPQVGILKKIFVVDVGEGLFEFINPIILEREGEVYSSEGCLSLPGRSGVVRRPETVTIQALDRYNEPFTLQADGILAICISHEYDHLQGTLFIDQLVPEDELPEEFKTDSGEDEE